MTTGDWILVSVNTKNIVAYRPTSGNQHVVRR